MELRYIRIFVMTAEYLSFSKVAERAFISQSSVSRYISALEAELGEELFARDTHGVLLTNFGGTFLPFAKKLLDDEEESLSFLQNYKHGLRYSTLNVGIENSLAISPPDVFFIHLFSAINAFKDVNPQVNLKIRFYGTDVFTLLSRNTIDVALTAINTCQIEGKITSSVNFKQVEVDYNYLAVPRQTDIDRPLQKILSGIECFFITNDSIAQSITASFINTYKLLQPVKVCENWVDIFVHLLSKGGGALLPGHLRDVTAHCGLKTVDLKGFNVSSGLYALWNKDNYNSNIQNFVLDLEQKFFEKIPDAFSGPQAAPDIDINSAQTE